MKKIWLVAKVTYRGRVRAGSFLLLTFGLPLLMIVAGALPFFVGGGERPLPSVGIVDESGQLTLPEHFPTDSGMLTVSSFADQSTARNALRAGHIGAYLVVPADYLAGTPPTLYVAGAADNRLRSALTALLRAALIPNAPTWLFARLADPATFSYRDITTGVAITSNVGRVSRFLIPILLALLFGFLVFTTANQLGSAIVREKDQRAMEIVITSLAPYQLVVGKVAGIALLSLTQIVVWCTGGAVALLLSLAGAFDLQQISVPWQAVIWTLLLGIPTYFLYAVLAAGLGLIAGDHQQAQQLAGIVGFMGLAPLWLMGLIVANPDGLLAQALTFFPLTSPMIGPLRMAFGIVPTWQLSVALVIIALCLAASIWLVTRVFRAALLLYGQTLRPQAIWQALRTG